jgi:hypothetical protein
LFLVWLTDMLWSRPHRFITYFTFSIFGEIVLNFHARASSEKITVISVTALVKIENFLNFLYAIINLTEFLSVKTSMEIEFILYVPW